MLHSDGFPHSVDSFRFLHSLFQDNDLTKDVCFLKLATSDEVCINRVLKRQVCKNCSHIYNLASAPSKKRSACDYCKGKIVIRQSDTNEILKDRLIYFHSQVEPIQQIAKELYPIVTIKSEQPLNDLKTQYDKLVKNYEYALLF